MFILKNYSCYIDLLMRTLNKRIRKFIVYHNMEDLKNQLEAILFSVGKKISIEELSRLCKVTNQKIIESKLQELIK